MSLPWGCYLKDPCGSDSPPHSQIVSELADDYNDVPKLHPDDIPSHFLSYPLRHEINDPPQLMVLKESAADSNPHPASSSWLAPPPADFFPVPPVHEDISNAAAVHHPAMAIHSSDLDARPVDAYLSSNSEDVEVAPCDAFLSSNSDEDVDVAPGDAISTYDSEDVDVAPGDAISSYDSDDFDAGPADTFYSEGSRKSDYIRSIYYTIQLASSRHAGLNLVTTLYVSTTLCYTLQCDLPM